MPRLHPPQPISAATTGNSSGNSSNRLRSVSGCGSFERTAEALDGSSADKQQPAQLWRQSLWGDVLVARAARGMPFSLPDTERCLIFQKLQVSARTSGACSLRDLNSLCVCSSLSRADASSVHIVPEGRNHRGVPFWQRRRRRGHQRVRRCSSSRRRRVGEGRSQTRCGYCFPVPLADD